MFSEQLSIYEDKAEDGDGNFAIAAALLRLAQVQSQTGESIQENLKHLAQAVEALKQA